MPPRWLAPTLLAFAVALVVAGMGYTLYENLRVAPHAVRAEAGRLHPHTKNATRLLGDADAVRAQIARAVLLDRAAAMPPLPSDWREAIRMQIQASDRPRHTVVLPGDDDAALFALPGAYWAVYAGVPVAFAGREAIPEAELARIAQLGLPIYVIAPRFAVSDAVLARLAAIAPTVRVAGETPPEHAVAIASYRDEETDFGWGRPIGERDGYYHYVLATPLEFEHALAALPLAWTNAASFLFTGPDGGLPAETDRYLWGQRTMWAVTPSEGPFRHLWVLGNRTSYAAHSRADFSLEKADYLAMGPAALGPLEGLSIVFIALGLASAAFVLVHSVRLLPEVMPAARYGWVGASLLLPVLGPILYLAAYRRPVMNPGEAMPHWRRPPVIQAAAATAVAFGYGAPFMIAIGYLFVWFGFPLFFRSEFAVEGWDFLLGAGMPIMMFGMWAGAILLAWLAVQYPMRRMMGRENAFWPALGITALSMTAVSLGMMTISWYMLMEKAKMMPHEDEILWFGSMWLASFLGFLVAWPLNAPLVRTGLKPGAM